ncbi:hypothetical protein [Erythrobacter sp. EC-HK427]|uniref:hypothetical protein n=1 Tax=Erythrobacter sp. EC-HK427 TaxID=2038396 RepID=UPI00125A50DC|nr:hypothetical protein [Erythrobacter sp. EC-HK427]VVT02783.1 conserved hypothetical protein [Erythrobacter sp. EC-HK427]
MSVLTPGFGNGAGRPLARQTAQANALAMRWAALSDAGTVVATLAGVAPVKVDQAVKSFPAQIRDAEPWRQELAENGCADLAAIMEPGLAALLAINARGSNGRAAAEALWEEFTAARNAIMALVPPAGHMGPRRSA